MKAHNTHDLAERIASRCDKATPTGARWQACCPAHDDHHPSLTITPHDDKVLLYCHAGCSVKAITGALGMQMKDLFLSPRGQRANGHKRLVKVYDYYDAHGALVHQTVRYDPKDFRQRRPDPTRPGEYIWNLKGIEPVLYNLPDVLEAKEAGEVIHLVEGEKDANTLIALGFVATTAPMGAKYWRESYTNTLSGADVVLWPDNDEAGRASVIKVGKALAIKTKLLRVVAVPAPYKDVTDWVHAGATRAELDALVQAQAPFENDSQHRHAAPQGAPGQPLAPKPDIYIGPDIERVVNEAQAALLAFSDTPIVYQRARALCVISRGGNPPKWLHRPQDTPVIIDASAAHLWELAGRAAHWWKHDKRGRRGEEWEEALPPKWAIDALQDRKHWPFPPLEGIVCSPTLRPDGSLLNVPGYDPDTGLYLDLNGTQYPTIPARPTLDDARTALGHLQEPLRDFPFAEPWHFSATLAAILSLVCRFAIQGNVPLFAIRANTRGSGKSLLADVVSIIGTGRGAPRWPQVTEDEEERKRLLTVALAGYTVIHIDNVTKPLGSPALDLALTAPSFSDRILGKHDSREAPLSMVWLASGNNMQFKGDTARRIVPIDLDPKMEKPEERTGFTHSPLIPWVQQERPRLTVAALTILKAYFAAGHPSQGLTPMGSFEQWSDLIRQALIWAGEDDPNEGRKDIEAESDPEYERLATLLDAWAACYPIPQGRTRSGPKELTQVLADIAMFKKMDKAPEHPPKPNEPNAYDKLQDALGAFDSRYDGRGLRSGPISNKLRVIQGRMIGDKRLISMGKTRTNKTLWGIESFEPLHRLHSLA
jgi:hypothetical protein